VSEYNEVFPGYQSGKVVQFFRDQRFEDHLCPHPQGCWIDVGKVDNPVLLFIPVKAPFSGPPFCHWGPSVSGVCGCASALVCMRYLCFPGFNSCEVCSGWVISCHRCLTCLKGLCCVCTQVSGSVVSNWPLCEFWTCVLWFFWYIYFYSSIFLRHQTMDKVQKYNSFKTWFEPV
jgi:hypothetical protein